MIECYIIRNGGMAYPATDHDKDEFKKLKPYTPYRAEYKQVSRRSLQHHKLYFGGLLRLAMDYWEPAGGLVSPDEKRALTEFCDWLGGRMTDPSAMVTARDTYLARLYEARSNEHPAPHKDIKALHEWVKLEAGYFDWVATPGGMTKQSRSINFNAMSQEEFEQFYKAAFSVVWRFILSRTFGSEAEAENVISRLVAMG